MLDQGAPRQLLVYAAQELNRVGRRRTWPEDRADTELAQFRRVRWWDDATRPDHHVVQPALAQLFQNAREQGHVRAGEDAQANGVDVLLQRRFGDHLRCLADTGVDHLEPGITQRSSDDLRPAIVAVQARFGNQYAQRRAVRHRIQPTAVVALG